MSASLFQLVCVAHIWNLVKYAIAKVVCHMFFNLFLATNSSFRLLNIYLSRLVNPSYIENMYRASILVVPIPFSCILVR